MTNGLRPGLRGRLAVALVLTSGATLGVAAYALLSPLEQRLRHDQARTLATTVTEARGGFAAVPLRGGRPQRAKLRRVARTLATRAGGRVAVFDEHGGRVFDTNPEGTAIAQDVQRAARLGRSRRVITGNQARVTVPVRMDRELFVVVARKRLTDAARATAVVRHAFIAAAAAGLGIALLLALTLARTLLRRLRRLRDAVREVGRRGLEAPAPGDSGADEIGELAIAFAAMHERLRRQDAARRAFVSTASHELRTPLASLQGLLELARDDLRPGVLDLDDARGRLDHAWEQVRVLGQLAVDLLDLSRLDSELELRNEPLDINELARAVAAEFDIRAAARVELQPTPGEAWALGDPGAVARIIRILLDNALRFAPAGSAVRIEVTTAEGTVSLAVSDEGPGVPDDEHEEIFERFRRGRCVGGTPGFGLGLAIGRELAQRMGGSLELANGGQPGARFVLRLLTPAPGGTTGTLRAFPAAPLR
jgi:signal transduction histidine kinase